MNDYSRKEAFAQDLSKEKFLYDNYPYLSLLHEKQHHIIIHILHLKSAHEPNLEKKVNFVDCRIWFHNYITVTSHPNAIIRNHQKALVS